jgi:hypothetical protein
MGGACSTHGEMINVYKTSVGNTKGRGHSEELGVDGRMILELILGKIWWEGVEWRNLAQDRDQWRFL